MLSLPDISTISQFCVRMLSTLVITSCKGALIFILIYLISRKSSLLPSLKHVLLFSVFLFFFVAPIWSVLSQLYGIEVLKIGPGDSETYHSVSSILLLNAPEVSGPAVQNSIGYSAYHEIGNLSPIQFQWPFWLCVVWGLGVLVTISPVAYGLMNVAHMKRRATREENGALMLTVRAVSANMGIKANIPLYASAKCQTPFASNIIFPAIIVPADFKNWPKEQIRTVLLHELSHIKRRDPLTQLLARLICSLFWFLPFLWMGYSQLRIEQEKSCDAMSIGSGVYPADYATHLINLIRHLKIQTLTSAVYIFKGRKKMLEKRIVNALQFKHSSNQTPKGLRYVLVVFLLCLAALLFINPVSAEDVSGAKELLLGTWINTDYNFKAESAKVIWKPDGKFEGYTRISDTAYCCGASYIIEDTWNDGDQNTWYKVRTSSDRYYYELIRISKSGAYYELVFTPNSYPDALDPKHPNYRAYYRFQ